MSRRRSILMLSWTVCCGMTSPLTAQSIARAVVVDDRQVTAGRETVGLESKVTMTLDDVLIKDALTAVARQAGLRITLTDEVAQIGRRVSLHASRMTVGEAFRGIIKGSPVRMQVGPRGQLLFALSEPRDRTKQGTVTGKVVDGATKRPIAGAVIVVDGTEINVRTADDGTFRLVHVPTGTQTLLVRGIGYAKTSRQVSVNAEGTVSVDVTLDAAVNALDQVVVTGTVVQTELKAVPSAMAVITAKQIEERGITKIDQLFRGDIPGLFAQNRGSNAFLDEVTMFSRGATALSSNSAGTSLGTNPIKTYVDGVEMADSKYLSQIDPRSIERIEILTGPQASTLYGSNALNGVMQIFTKRGTAARPQLTINLLSGLVENNFSNARTPQHDYSGQLTGVESRLSYNVGASWQYIGAWTPAKRTARMSAYGGSRLELPTTVGRVSADFSLRHATTTNRQEGWDAQRSAAMYEIGRWWGGFSDIGLTNPTTYTLAGQTLGLTVTYAPTGWWSHELGFGRDIADVETRFTDRMYSAPRDTALRLIQNQNTRRSIRYSSTAQIPMTTLGNATITLGADEWQNVTGSTTVDPQTLSGSLTGTTSLSRQPGHNTGGFVQTQLGVRDRLFLTYGMRAEWNPGFGDDAQPNLAPRYGVAYTQDVGPLTAKLRGSYGRYTRPPAPKLKAPVTAVEWYGSTSTVIRDYGNFVYTVANPELGPENQQGGEGGLELYLGTRGSIVVTRYNQTVDGLIAIPTVDSARSLLPCLAGCSASIRDADGYGYLYKNQYLNIGSIRNQGWELQGSMNLGPFTTRGTYSWTKSRTIGVNPKYQYFFTPQSYPQYQKGATYQYLPEHTWALGATYARARTTMALNVTGIGRVRNSGDVFSWEYLGAWMRLMHDRPRANSGGYVSFNNHYTMMDLTAAHRFTTRVEGLLQVQNLADKYVNDYWSAYAAIGRQTKAGLRFRLQ